MVPADSRRIPRVPRYSGYRYADLASHTGLSPSVITFSKCSVHHFSTMSRSYNPSHALRRHWFGLFPVCSPLLGNHSFIFLPAGTKMFQFPALALLHLVRVTVLQTARLSHSEIFGSRVICTYPKLIAAYHVLHRLREPRHPPYALSYFLYDCILVTRLT